MRSTAAMYGSRCKPCRASPPSSQLSARRCNLRLAASISGVPGCDAEATVSPAAHEALTHEQVDAYLARLSRPRPQEPTLEALAAISAAHQHAVPFENLSVHLQERVHPSNTEALYSKVVLRRRGGFCYELNSLLAALLAALGYDVAIHPARVHQGDASGAYGALFDHMALVVSVGGARFIVDVGFGRFALAPVRVCDAEDPAPETADRAGTFRVAAVDGPCAQDEWEVRHNGAAAYRLATWPAPRSDFEPHCWWHCTCPSSHFTKSVICSRVTEAGRVSVSGKRLIRTTDAGERWEEVLADEAAVLHALKQHFGVEIDRLPSPLHP